MQKELEVYFIKDLKGQFLMGIIRIKDKFTEIIKVDLIPEDVVLDKKYKLVMKT